jgi:hypothetical protein
MWFLRNAVKACAIVILLTGALGATDASAMPMFARKFAVECSHCHTTIPRLNETGYKFRAAGFRLLTEMPIGKPEEEKFELGNAFSARIQARFDTQATNQPNGAPIANCPANVCGPRTKTNALSFMEATLYPLTGSWGRYFATESELSVSPEDVFEIENAYVRMVRGNEKNFFTSRVGVFHPWEGFGASDRPFSNARPLFQTSGISAGGRGVPSVYQPWGLDEVGIEVGGDLDNLSLRAAVLGGTMMRWEEEAGAFIPFPAQTGPWKGANQAPAALGKAYNSVGHNAVDFSANATYILHPEGGGVSLIYYHGQVATPTQCADGTAIGRLNAETGDLCGVSAAGEVGMSDFDFTEASAFRNHFDRVSAYASYPLGNFMAMAGYHHGRDETPVNPTAFSTNSALQKFSSTGSFAEGTYSVNQYMAGGVRYDRFRPNTGRPSTQWAVTPYVNIPLNNGFQLIAEYQHRDFQLDASHHRQNDTFQVRIIFIQ